MMATGLSASRAGYPEASPSARQFRPDCRRGVSACPTGAASRPTIRAAIPSRGGSAARQNRRRSSGTHCAVCSRRSPHRTCIRNCKCAPPPKLAEGLYRNTRSSAGFAAPWWSRDVWATRIIANQPLNANAESPSISAISRKIYRCNSLSGSLELCFNRSSTIDERTCATLWCGISTSLTISDRLFRSRSTTFSR